MRLIDLHPLLSRVEREAMAAAAGIGPEYLAQLATHFKSNPSMTLCAALVAHDKRLTLKDLAAEFGKKKEPKRTPDNHPGQRATDRKGR